jgi:hypothetical protein
MRTRARWGAAVGPDQVEPAASASALTLSKQLEQ